MSKLYDEFKEKSERTGYYVNPDVEFVEMLLNNIKINEERYGYGACPCRLASGNREKDMDLICPCDYRDIDLKEYGYCFCALYVTKEVIKDHKKIKSIPDRRINELAKKQKTEEELEQVIINNIKFPIWRCKVCGYLCCRPEPPEECPICHVDKDRFEKLF